MGLQGYLAEFDELVKQFLQSKQDQTKRDQVGESAKKELDKYDQGGEEENEEKYKSAKYYIKVMAKIVSNSDEWVIKEGERLSGILMSGNLSKQKEKWFQQRLNILSVFAGLMRKIVKTTRIRILENIQFLKLLVII